jgi:hypothetical protein
MAGTSPAMTGEKNATPLIDSLTQPSYTLQSRFAGQIMHDQ